MAYIISKPDDDKAPLGQGVVKLSNASAGPTGGTVGTVTGSSLGAGTQGTPAGTASGSFVNLNQYLDANKEQAQGLAQKVAGTIGTEKQQAVDALGNASTNIGSAIKSGTINYNPNVVQSAIKAPTGLDTSTAQALSTLTAGKYTGPQNARETGMLSGVDKEVNDLNEIKSLANTSGGRQQLITQSSGNRAVNRGGLSLDELLLQNNQDARGILDTAVSDTQPVFQMYNDTEQSLANQIAEARRTSELAGEQARNELGAAGSNVESEIQANVAARRKAFNNQQLAAQAELASGSVSDDTLRTLGVTREQFNQLNNTNARARAEGGSSINLADYVTLANAEGAINARNTATPEQAARYQALMNLSGRQGNFISPAELQAQQDFAKFDITGASNQANAILQSGLQRKEAERINQEQIAQQKQAMDAAETAARKARQVQTATTAASIGLAIAVFCYAAGTKILMENGVYTEVQNIKLGDQTYLGGTVYGVATMVSTEMYMYKGAYVTGAHAVFENNNWLRVRDSLLAVKVELENPVMVYPIITEHHLTVTNTHISADVIEFDDYENYTNSSRIEHLNSMTERNIKLSLIDNEFFISNNKVKV